MYDPSQKLLIYAKEHHRRFTQTANRERLLKHAQPDFKAKIALTLFRLAKKLEPSLFEGNPILKPEC